MKGLVNAIKKHSPTLLCFIAAGGVISTAVLAAKATPKAIKLIEDSGCEDEEPINKKKMIITAAPAYIPAIISGALTIGYIFSANYLNKRQQAILTSAYALLNDSYSQYKAKNIELNGIDAHERIMRELAVEKSSNPFIYAQGVFGEGACSTCFEGSDEEKHLFFDSFSNRYFEATFSQVLNAELHLNRNLALGANMSVNDFYSFLGIEPTAKVEKLGWSLYPGNYMFVDFNHIGITLDDGLQCWIIECSPLCDPAPDYDE